MTRAGDRPELSARGEAERSGGAIEAAIAEQDYRRAVALCAREHGAAIGRVCMALVGSRASANELTRETFVAAYRSFEADGHGEPLRAWLFGVARKKCLKHLEQQRRRHSALEVVEGDEDGAAPKMARERARRARAALADVRPTAREALVLRYVGQLSFGEVATACGIDEATARQRVSGALIRLREALDRREND